MVNDIRLKWSVWSPFRFFLDIIIIIIIIIVCVFVTPMYCAKTAEPIKMPFEGRGLIHEDPIRNYVNRRNFRKRRGPDALPPHTHFLEWGTEPSLYKYHSSLVPHFSDESYANDYVLDEGTSNTYSHEWHIYMHLSVYQQRSMWRGTIAPFMHQ